MEKKVYLDFGKFSDDIFPFVRTLELLSSFVLRFD